MWLKMIITNYLDSSLALYKVATAEDLQKSIAVAQKAFYFGQTILNLFPHSTVTSRNP